MLLEHEVDKLNDQGLSLHKHWNWITKAVFVSPENTCRKLFYTLVCVWQLWKIRSMENHLCFDWKIIYALSVKSFTLWFYLQTDSKNHTWRERAWAHSSHGPKPISKLTLAKLQPAQIVPPHHPDQAAPSSRSHASQASSFFSLLPLRCRHLDRSLASRSLHHHPRLISFLTHPRLILSPPLKTDLFFSIYLSFPQSFVLPPSQFDWV